MRSIFAAIAVLTQPWLVASDLHVDAFDRGTAPSGYHADPNWPLFESTVRAMKNAAPHAPVVIIPGDFLAHQWSSKARAAHADPAQSAQAAMARIAHTFNRAFPKAQFVIALGNNDDPCGDYRTGPNAKYLANVAQIWAPLVNRNGASPDFKRDFSYAGYYSARLPGGARALALDTTYFSIFFRACGRGEGVAPQQIAWLGAALERSAHNVLVMHVPPGIDPTATLLTHRFLVVPYWNDSSRRAFERIVGEHQNDIAFSIAGHSHRTDFRVVSRTPMLVAPAVSAIYQNNPSFTRLEVSADGRVRDYQTYAYDYDANAWTQIFDFSRSFGAQSFDADSLERAHERIAADTSVRRLWAVNLVGASDAAGGAYRSWLAYWCAQTESASGYSACAGDRRRTAVVPLLLGAAAAIVVLLVVWYSFKRPWTRPRKNV